MSDDPVRTLAQLNAQDRRHQERVGRQLAKRQRRKLRPWVVWTCLALVVCLGAFFVVHRSQGHASETDSHPSCQAYREALSVDLALPGSNQPPQATSMALLTTQQRKSVTASRGTFLSSVIHEASDQHAVAESEYQAELNQGPYQAGPPSPPPPTEAYESSAVQSLIPRWNSWATSLRETVLRSRGCS
jgi:hypothetical protein